MKEQRTSGAQLVLAVSILGILGVLTSLYLLFPQPTKTGEPRYGRTEEALRDEYTQLLRKTGLSTEYAHCKYHPKSLALSCEVPPLKESNLIAATNALGWKTSDQNKNESVFLVKDGYGLSMACPVNRAQQSCEITLRVRAATGA